MGCGGVTMINYGFWSRWRRTSQRNSMRRAYDTLIFSVVRGDPTNVDTRCMYPQVGISTQTTYIDIVIQISGALQIRTLRPIRRRKSCDAIGTTAPVHTVRVRYSRVSQPDQASFPAAQFHEFCTAILSTSEHTAVL